MPFYFCVLINDASPAHTMQWFTVSYFSTFGDEGRVFSCLNDEPCYCIGQCTLRASPASLRGIYTRFHAVGTGRRPAEVNAQSMSGAMRISVRQVKIECPDDVRGDAPVWLAQLTAR